MRGGQVSSQQFDGLIDATLAGPDAVFLMLESVLKRIHIELAERVLFAS